MKKLLILNYEFPPIGGGGGRVSYDTALCLSQAGKFKIDIITAAYKEHAGTEKINENLTIHRVKCLRRRKDSSTPLEHISYLIAAYKKFTELNKEFLFDLCHCHFIMPTGFLAWHLRRKYGLPYVLTAHGSDTLGFNPKFRSYYPLLRPAWRMVLAEATSINCASQHLKKRILEHAPFLREDDISILPNRIPTKHLSPRAKKKYILLASRMVKSKGIQDFLDAFANAGTRGWKVIIAGDGPYRKQLVRKIRVLHLTKRVRMTGWIDQTNPRLAKLFGEASIFVCPSHFENMNVSLLEALQAGCALMATNVGGNPETVEGVGVLFPPKDPKTLALKLRSLVNDEEQLQKYQAQSIAKSRKLSTERNLTQIEKYLISKLPKSQGLVESRHWIKPIHVCFISRSAYPIFDSGCKATFGGAEVDSYLIATELARDPKYQVSFITGDFGQNGQKVVSGVRLYKSYRFEDNRLIQLIKLIEQIIAVDADWYFQESASGGAGVIQLICKWRKKKFAYRTASDIDTDGTYIRDNWFEGRFYKYGITNADVVISQNESHKRQLRKLHNIKSILIKNGYQLPSKINGRGKFILWVARSDKLKRPEMFLKLAKRFPQQKFMMVCPRAHISSVDYGSLMKEAKKIKNLVFIPGVSFQEIDSYFARAKLFVNTSIYEGFPNTFVQATMHGCPVCSLSVNPDNFILKNNCGAIANGDFEKFVQSIGRLLTDRQHYSQVSNNAFFYAQNNHDITTVTEKYKKVFKHE